jgi:hypothetical protein
MGSHAFNRHGEPVAGKLLSFDALFANGARLSRCEWSSAHVYQALPVMNNSSISLTRLQKRHDRGGDQRYVISSRASQVMLTSPTQFDIFLTVVIIYYIFAQMLFAVAALIYRVPVSKQPKPP